MRSSSSSSCGSRPTTHRPYSSSTIDRRSRRLSDSRVKWTTIFTFQTATSPLLLPPHQQQVGRPAIWSSRSSKRLWSGYRRQQALMG